MTDPLEPVRRLKAALNRIALPLGTEVVAFAVTPADDESGTDVADVMFRVLPGAFQSQEQRDTAAQFEEIMSAGVIETPEPNHLEKFRDIGFEEWMNE